MEYSIYTAPIEPQLTIQFESTSEPKQLLAELQTWTPRGGWSHLAQQLFEALNNAAKAGR